MDYTTPGFPVLHQLQELVQMHLHQVSDSIQPSHPLCSPSLPALNLAQHQGLLRWVSSSHKVAKYWSFSFSISPSNEYSGVISFRIDKSNLLAVQGTLNLMSQLVKNLSAVRETWVPSLGWEDPLKKGKATHSSTLAWRILTKSWIRLSNFQLRLFSYKLCHSSYFKFFVDLCFTSKEDMGKYAI